MKTRSVSFFSNGRRLAGDLYTPAGHGTWPLIIVCSGYLGLRHIHPARLARGLVPHGFAVLGFDYAGWGDSEGVRLLVSPQQQVEDVRSAVCFVDSLPEVDSERMSVIGWALGGSVAVAAAAEEPRLRGVVAVNPLGDGERALRSMHDETTWQELLQRVSEDRRQRAAGVHSELVDAFFVTPLDEVTQRYVDKRLRETPGFSTQVLLETADHWLRFRPEQAAAHLAPRPLLLVHGTENHYHLPDESQSIYAHAGEPKELVQVQGGHVEWMLDDHPLFQQLVDLTTNFLGHHGLDHAL